MDAQYALGQPSVGLLAMLIIGALAGWIAEKITKSDHGIFTNILVGIAGAFIGGKLAGSAAGAGIRLLAHADRGRDRRGHFAVHLARVSRPALGRPRAYRLRRVAMRDLDDTRPRRQLLDQRIGGGAVLVIEIGVPFVEQIDRRLGMRHDLLERTQLPLAG